MIKLDINVKVCIFVNGQESRFASSTMLIAQIKLIIMCIDSNHEPQMLLPFPIKNTFSDVNDRVKILKKFTGTLKVTNSQ